MVISRVKSGISPYQKTFSDGKGAHTESLGLGLFKPVFLNFQVGSPAVPRVEDVDFPCHSPDRASPIGIKTIDPLVFNGGDHHIMFFFGGQEHIAYHDPSLFQTVLDLAAGFQADPFLV